MNRKDFAERFHLLARTCAAGGAPLYAHLSSSAAQEVESGGAFLDVLEPFWDEPVRRLLPLRIFGQVHRWVLAGELPDLARHYPSVGGALPPDGAWPKFRQVCIDRSDQLPELLARPHQHNEVGRAAPLAAAFLLLARETGSPLRTLEVGASAGLLLRWDHYRDSWWFPEMFDVRPPLDGDAAVVERRGCDLYPIDPTSKDGALTLKALVWADLVEHIRMLDDAIEISKRVPAPVDQADGAEWLERELARQSPGVVTVVFRSVMQAAATDASLARMTAALESAAARATPEAPLADLRFETDSVVPALHRPPQMQLKLTTWPGGVERLLATADINGRRVRWLN